MGKSYSKEDFAKSARLIYEDILCQPTLLPDVGIDPDLLKYSGPDSNAVLQDYSNEILNKVPDYINSFGSAISALKSVSDAVGLGAFVISMIIEIAIKLNTQTDEPTYNLIRRVFGEEKASSVRDTMSEYLKRHAMFINDTPQLQKEIGRLEQQLSMNLTILGNSLLDDGQMSSRGFKIWVNGAAFHVQMLIHEARLQDCEPETHSVEKVKVAISLYLGFLDSLLEKYKTFKINSDVFVREHPWYWVETPIDYDPCYMYNREIEGCRRNMRRVYAPSPCTGEDYPNPCGYKKEVMAALMDIIYSEYEPVKGLKSYFLNIQNNLTSLIHQHGSFTLPSAVAKSIEVQEGKLSFVFGNSH